jgi:hypothetical protein
MVGIIPVAGAIMSTTLKPETSPEPLVPPDESTWRRYSAHKEGEASWLTSFVLHGLVIGVIVALGLLIKEQRDNPTNDKDSWKTLFQPNRRAIAKPVVMDPSSTNPAGKKNPGGRGGDPAPGENFQPEARDPGKAGEKALVDTTMIKLDPVDTQQMVQKMPEWLKDTKTGQRFITTGEADPRILLIRDANEQALKKLNEGLREPVGDPKQGGQPGGTGTNPNEGGDEYGGARGRSAATEREKRMYRWKMDFNLPQGSEAQRIDAYLHQLDSLGAILAVPTDRANTRFLVIRKLLDHPVKPMLEDPGKLRMIYWYETNPAMAQALARHLKLAIPNGYIILMPQSLEATMERLEREKAPPGIRTDDIEETRFKVIPAGGGGYTVECVSVRPK